jgi:hypothetical protein
MPRTAGRSRQSGTDFFPHIFYNRVPMPSHWFVTLCPMPRIAAAARILSVSFPTAEDA